LAVLKFVKNRDFLILLKFVKFELSNYGDKYVRLNSDWTSSIAVSTDKLAVLLQIPPSSRGLFKYFTK